ncbi:MAG: hypothetical protein KF819_31105 [Labilithrix sp.]|nr:hypothetical protein [Labilithrix sp.]
MRHRRSIALGLALGTWAAASCGGSSDTTTNPVDEPDAALPREASATDAPAEAEASASCDLGPLPTMPPLTSEVVIAGPDGGAPPAATGGDETGVWVYTKITLHLPSQASGQIDPAESKIEGTGSIQLDGATFRQFSDTTTVLSTSVVGKITRAGSAKAIGTYEKGADGLTFAVTCRETTGEGGTLGEVGFSRIDATHGRLHVVTMTQLGSANLVIDLEKAP